MNIEWQKDDFVELPMEYNKSVNRHWCMIIQTCKSVISHDDYDDDDIVDDVVIENDNDDDDFGGNQETKQAEVGSSWGIWSLLTRNCWPYLDQIYSYQRKTLLDKRYIFIM